MYYQDSLWYLDTEFLFIFFLFLDFELKHVS